MPQIEDFINQLRAIVTKDWCFYGDTPEEAEQYLEKMIAKEHSVFEYFFGKESENSDTMKKFKDLYELEDPNA